MFGLYATIGAFDKQVVVEGSTGPLSIELKMSHRLTDLGSSDTVVIQIVQFKYEGALLI